MTEAEGSVGWRARAVGPRRLYARLLFDLADFGAWTWRVFVVGVPAVTFAVGWVFGGELVYPFTMYAAVTLLFVFQTTERFVDTEVELRPNRGELTARYNLGDPTLFGNGHETTVSLADVEAARFLNLAGRRLVLFEQTNPFAQGTAFLVPTDAEPTLRDALADHGATVSDDETTGWVRRRVAVTLSAVVVAPLAALVVWPVVYSWPLALVTVVVLVTVLNQGADGGAEVDPPVEWAE